MKKKFLAVLTLIISTVSYTNLKSQKVIYHENFTILCGMKKCFLKNCCKPKAGYCCVYDNTTFKQLN